MAMSNALVIPEWRTFTSFWSTCLVWNMQAVLAKSSWEPLGLLTRFKFWHLPQDVTKSMPQCEEQPVDRTAPFTAVGLHGQWSSNCDFQSQTSNWLILSLFLESQFLHTGDCSSFRLIQFLWHWLQLVHPGGDFLCLSLESISDQWDPAIILIMKIRNISTEKIGFVFRRVWCLLQKLRKSHLWLHFVYASCL